MRNSVAVIAALCLAIGLFCGCGGSGGDSSDGGTTIVGTWGYMSSTSWQYELGFAGDMTSTYTVRNVEGDTVESYSRPYTLEGDQLRITETMRNGQTNVWEYRVEITKNTLTLYPFNGETGQVYTRIVDEPVGQP